MRELPLLIKGCGEVRGYVFRQIERSAGGYIYQVTHPDIKSPHYEVWRRKINKLHNVVSKPTSKAFGTWAWSFRSIEKAREKLKQLHT